MKRIRQSGLSLIELIIVTVILGTASVPILGQFTQVTRGTLINEDIHTATQLAQESAEGILALRRNQGFGAVALGSSNELLTGKFASFSRNVTVTESNSLAACLSGAACKDVVVIVKRGLIKRAEIAYMLVDY